MRDPYLYDDVDVIKNKLGIKDSIKLEAAESDIVPIKLLDVDKYADGIFDLEKLQLIHRHLFGNIYEWAGEFRKIDIEKSELVLDGMSVKYCSHENIDKEAKKVISEINNVKWEKLNVDERAEAFAKLTSKLWQVHLFREGNTRTTITFMELFAKSREINIDRELLKNNPGHVRKSLVLASIGEYSEYEHLIKIIKDAIIEEVPGKTKDQKKQIISESSELKNKLFNMKNKVCFIQKNIDKIEKLQKELKTSNASDRIKLDKEIYNCCTLLKNEGYEGKTTIELKKDNINKIENRILEFDTKLKDINAVINNEKMLNNNQSKSKKKSLNNGIDI